MGEWYRDNGVLKYRFNSGKSSKSSFTSKPTRANAAPPKASGQSSYLATGGENTRPNNGGYKISTKPRKNGVFQGWKVEGKKDKAKRAADRRSSSNAGEQYAKSLEAKAAPSAKRAETKRRLQRMESDPKNATALDKMRSERTKNKQYKGKYYGPDEFKGNIGMLKAWRKAGSPDAKKFARSAKAD